MEESILNYDCVKFGWKTVKLGDFIDFMGGGTPDKKNPDYWNGDIKWASVKDVKNKYLHTTQDKITELGLKNSSSQLAKDGELILVTRISPGKCVIARDNIAINQDLKIVKLKADVSTNFIYYFFTAKENEFIKRSSGTTVKGIRLEEIRIIEIDLPPLPEQRAIVSKIEQLFSELDNGISNLKLAQEQLKVYRQAVLKKAFEGELTKKWREQQTDLPNAGELLEQIKKEREEATKASGKKMKKVKPLTEAELSELPKLPDKWLWVKFGEACNKIFDGTHFSPQNSPQGDFKYITAKNIKEGYLDLSDLSYVTKEDHYEIFSRCDVKKGDILYIKDGATTGKACVNPLDEEFSLLSSVGVFRVNEKYISPKFIEHYLNAEVTRHQMLKNVAGVAITRLTLVKLNNSMLILPPTEEQQAIVQEIETRLSVCDKVEQDIETNLEKAEALRQSILKKAFEGKLLNESELAEVRGAEDWEPAEVLLERVKAEKEGNGKKGKQTSEKLKNVVLDDRELTQQYTLEVFNQIDK